MLAEAAVGEETQHLLCKGSIPYEEILTPPQKQTQPGLFGTM